MRNRSGYCASMGAGPCKQSRHFSASYPYQTMVPTMLLPYAQRPVTEVPVVFATATHLIFLYEHPYEMMQEWQ